MRCRLACGSLGHAVKLNELKFVRFRTLEKIYQGMAIQTVNFYPATGWSGSQAVSWDSRDWAIEILEGVHHVALIRFETVE